MVCNKQCPQFGTDFTYPDRSCIYGECTHCGEVALAESIRNSNEVIFNENKTISWRKWLKHPGKSAPDKCQIRGTVNQALCELLQTLGTLKPHIFRANWNRNVFEYARKNMLPGQVIQIFDFAMNFRNMYQDEVQSAYWDGSQTSIHAVINYYRCPNTSCSEVTMLILAQITDNLHHDSFVVLAAHDASF